MSRQITVYEAMWDKLGREPTNAELKAEVMRIFAEVQVKLATQARLPHQRKR